MKRICALLAAVVLGCGSSSGTGTDPDAGVTDGDGGPGPGGDDGGGGGGGGGSGAVARPIKLTLTNRPDNGGMFSFLVAYQDGSADWKLAPAPTGDTYTFDVYAPTYGVAFTCITQAQLGGAQPQRLVTSAFFAVTERTELTLDVPTRCTDRAPSTVTITGNVKNRPGNGVLVAQFGGRNAFVGFQTGNFQLQAPAGTRDLLILHAVPGNNGDFYTDDVLVRRDLVATSNTNVTLDFNESQPNNFFDVDVSAAPDNAPVIASTTLYTHNGTTATLVRESQNWETDSLADALQRDTDVYDQSITVRGFGTSVTVTHATTQPGPQTYATVPALGMVQTTIPTQQPYVTLQSTWKAYPEAVGYLWNVSQQATCANTLCSTQWQAYISPGVVGASPGFVMPDLSALAGWKEAFELITSSPVSGSVTAMTSSEGAADFPTRIPTDGTDRTFVRTDFNVTP